MLALSACGDDEPVPEDATIQIDLGMDASDPAGACLVVCQYYGPGEYRAECRATGGLLRCTVDAYPICDLDALPVGFDGGVFPAPLCTRVATGEETAAACALAPDGTPLLTEAPVVRCVAVE